VPGAALAVVPLGDLLAAFKSEAAQELRDVVLGTGERDAELVGDALVGIPGRDQASDFALAAGDRG
jgi:hypothetical protein